jgi:hypothetical protein
MLYIILYVSGVITTLSVVGFIYQLIQSGKKELELVSLKEQIKELTKEIGNKDNTSDKRLATIIWSGWYKNDNPQKKWDVTLEVREIALSQDESQSKFEVISAISHSNNDSWGTKEYGEHFLKRTGGGWINTKNPENKMTITWITTISKSEARQKKIDQLLNPDLSE